MMSETDDGSLPSEIDQEVLRSNRRLIDDCFVHDKDRLRHDDALALLRSRLAPIAGIEEVLLEEAHGRIAACDFIAPRNIPAFDNAAVDGYAVSHRDLATQGESRLKVTLRVPAGHPSPLSLNIGTAARIFTGAVMPTPADTVVMQEDVKVDTVDGETWVRIPEGVNRGINRRLAGEDMEEGSQFIADGMVLRPPEIAAIASAGIAAVDVYKPLRVALISTGDEILRPGEPFEEGGVYDANHYLLRALLESCGAEVEDFGVVPDDAAMVHAALKVASRRSDVIMTSGGASRGEEDHVVSTIADWGSLHAWQLAIKPGRPLVFGQLQDTVFLGLPGNPVAVMVCFLLYARPMLSVLGGGGFRAPQRYRVKAGFTIERKKPDRREFLRGWLEHDMLIGTVAKKYASDGSGLISSLRAADGLIELPESVTTVRPGEAVTFIPFSEFGLVPRGLSFDDDE